MTSDGSSRRTVLAGLGAAALWTPEFAHAGACVLTPRSIEGPFYLDTRLRRSHISEERPGMPLRVVLDVLEAASCRPLSGVRVDLWHADARGEYSGFDGQGDAGRISTRGRTFLRGSQFSDARGRVAFETIYPGWYDGRATHVHYKVFPLPGLVVTGQMYFPEAINDRIYRTVAAYAGRPVRREVKNANDFILNHDDPKRLTICRIEPAGGAYSASLTIGIRMSA